MLRSRKHGGPHYEHSRIEVASRIIIGSETGSYYFDSVVIILR